MAVDPMKVQLVPVSSLEHRGTARHPCASDKHSMPEALDEEISFFYDVSHSDPRCIQAPNRTTSISESQKSSFAAPPGAFMASDPFIKPSATEVTGPPGVWRRGSNASTAASWTGEDELQAPPGVWHQPLNADKSTPSISEEDEEEDEDGLQTPRGLFQSPKLWSLVSELRKALEEEEAKELQRISRRRNSDATVPAPPRRDSDSTLKMALDAAMPHRRNSDPTGMTSMKTTVSAQQRQLCLADMVPGEPSCPQTGFGCLSCVGPCGNNKKRCKKVKTPSAPQGIMLSRGSKNHARGKCRPCRDFNSPQGCAAGVLCNFCHGDHGEKEEPEKTANTESEPSKASADQLPFYVNLSDAIIRPPPGLPCPAFGPPPGLVKNEKNEC